MNVKIRTAVTNQLCKISDLLLNNAILILVIGCTVVFILIYTNWSWEYWAEQTIRDGKLWEIKLERARIVQQIAVAVLAFPALAFAIWRTITAHRQASAALSQAATAARSQSLDRYTNAASLLDTGQASVRRAGLLALGQLALDHPEQYYRSSIQLLAGFVRDTTAIPSTNKSPDEVELALKQISIIRETAAKAETYDDFRVDLDSINIKSCVILRLYLADAFLAHATFDDMQFFQCDLARTIFSFATFKTSRISTSDLTDSRFVGSNFDQGIPAFEKCNISGAQLKDSTGLRSIDVGDCWAWKDNPPILPSGIELSNLFDPGENDEFCIEHDKLENALRYLPPANMH